MSEQNGKTKSELIDAFKKAGLKAGDGLIVHSSYKSVAPVAGGPKTIIDALLEVIGPDGNLMLPTFNYSLATPEPYFAPGQTPCRTGIVPELGRKRPDAVRSLHPSHSVAVIGPKARELTEGHLDCRAVGVGSPIDRLAEMGGKVMLLGVGHVSNTTVHVGEDHAGISKVPYLENETSFKVLLNDGRIIEHLLDSSPSCSSAFGAIEYPLRKNEKIIDAKIDSCKIQLMLVKDVIDAVVESIKEKPDILLCTHPDCRQCSIARRKLKEQGRI